MITINFIIIYSFICYCIDYYLKADGYKGPKNDHFNGKRFKNYFSKGNFAERMREKAGDDLPALSFFFKKLVTAWKRRSLPAGKSTPPARVLGGEILVTFINHSTVLIQTEGLNILTDPVWSEYASPVPYLGPRRYIEPGVNLKSLPEIDFVLLSHNHYDHLDISALKKIVKKQKTIIYTGLGNANFLKKRGVPGAIDMDWGESKKFSDEISVHCVPAQHFSARAVSDRNKTLWAGFVVKTPHGDIYFAGDSGYGSFIEHIKKIHPKGFRLAFLPIGAFKPRSFMGEVHMGPEEAVEVARELKIARAIPIHFGTFDLAVDRQDEPVQKLKETLAKPENSNIHFDVLLNGESIGIK